MKDVRINGYYMYKKHMVLYKVIMVTNSESKDQVKYPTTVVYEGANNKQWSRSLESFLEDFEEVKEPLTSDCPILKVFSALREAQEHKDLFRTMEQTINSQRDKLTIMNTYLSYSKNLNDQRLEQLKGMQKEITSLKDINSESQYSNRVLQRRNLKLSEDKRELYTHLLGANKEKLIYGWGMFIFFLAFILKTLNIF